MHAIFLQKRGVSRFLYENRRIFRLGRPFLCDVELEMVSLQDSKWFKDVRL